MNVVELIHRGWLADVKRMVFWAIEKVVPGNIKSRYRDRREQDDEGVTAQQEKRQQKRVRWRKGIR